MYGETDSAGYYNFSIEAGSYTLLAVKDGWFPATLPQFSLAAGETSPDQNFTLTQMSSGTITGTVYKRDHMVIYMVVASSQMATGEDLEFVSLYNPTTAQINMLTNPADSNSNNIRLSYAGETGLGHDVFEFWLQHRSTYVPAGYHYLKEGKRSEMTDDVYSRVPGR